MCNTQGLMINEALCISKHLHVQPYVHKCDGMNGNTDLSYISANPEVKDLFVCIEYKLNV